MNKITLAVLSAVMLGVPAHAAVSGAFSDAQAASDRYAASISAANNEALHDGAFKAESAMIGAQSTPVTVGQPVLVADAGAPKAAAKLSPSQFPAHKDSYRIPDRDRSERRGPGIAVDMPAAFKLGLVGAAAGALIGLIFGAPLIGAIAGLVVGAAVGYVVGRAIREGFQSLTSFGVPSEDRR